MDENTQKRLQELLELSSQSSSQEKLHYDSLISLHKYIVGVAAALIAVGSWFIGNSISDLKSSLNQEVIDLKASILKAEDETREYKSDLKESAKVMIEQTERQTQLQIALLREEVDIFKETAKSKISLAFEGENIQNMLKDATKTQVGNVLNEMVEKEVLETQNILPTLVLAVDQIREGRREWWDYVDSLSTKSDKKTIRSLASVILEQKRKDYKEYYSQEYEYLLSYIPSDNMDDDIEINPEVIKANPDSLVGILVTKTLNFKNLNSSARGFAMMEKLTGEKIAFLDFKQLPIWYKAYQFKKAKSKNR